MEEAKRIGEDYLALEKYVNLNYMVRGDDAPCGAWHALGAR